MSHFAKVVDGIVEQVIVVEQDVIDTGLFGDPSLWLQCSYNTRNGVHYGPDGKPDGGAALRGNYPSKGWVYDEVHDVFYPQKRWPSWILNITKWEYEAPVPHPGNDPSNNIFYKWDEETVNWIISDEDSISVNQSNTRNNIV